MGNIDSKEEYKKYKMELHEAMLEKQRVPYSIKRRMSESRIREFYNEAKSRGLNCHVSVGGLDSIVLGHLIREMGYTEDEMSYYRQLIRNNAHLIIEFSRDGGVLNAATA